MRDNNRVQIVNVNTSHRCARAPYRIPSAYTSPTTKTGTRRIRNDFYSCDGRRVKKRPGNHFQLIRGTHVKSKKVAAQTRERAVDPSIGWSEIASRNQRNTRFGGGRLRDEPLTSGGNTLLFAERAEKEEKVTRGSW